MHEIVFEVNQEFDGGFFAEALGYDIFTQADSWSELRSNIKEAVAGYFFDNPVNAMIRIHFTRNEIFSMT